MRGHVSEEKETEDFVVGKTTRDEVLAEIGSPSASSSYGGESWYYISMQRETVGPFATETIDQQVLKLSFDEAGILSKMEHVDKQAAQDISIARRETPSEGHSLGFMEQLVGNLGRFNASRDAGAAPGRKPGGGF